LEASPDEEDGKPIDRVVVSSSMERLRRNGGRAATGKSLSRWISIGRLEQFHEFDNGIRRIQEDAAATRLH
jgi:hypothetical protein